ncbi:MAG: hypothetical protein ACE5MB_05215 [Anaerolineae bacterium]
MNSKSNRTRKYLPLAVGALSGALLFLTPRLMSRMMSRMMQGMMGQGRSPMDM